MSERLEIMGSASEQVAAMPRRTAHALHALLEAEQEGHRNGKGPPLASEIVLYDAEARSARSTAAALARSPYAVYAGNGVWFASFGLHELRSALEDRYLAETVREDER